MRSAFSSCRLYSWMRLTWLSKIESGSTRQPGRRSEPVRELRLGLALGLADGVAEAAIVGERLQLRQLGEVGDPAVADGFGDAAGERRVRQQQPAPRRHAVGLVVEALGKHLGQVLDRHRAQQGGMDRGDAVGAVRADDGEVGHADLPLAALLDQAHSLDAAVVAGEAGAHLIEQAPVDLEDDLQMARQQQLEPRAAAISPAPRAAACGSCRRASVVVRSQAWSQPRPRLVEQNPHQLGDGHARVRVVELDGDLVGKRAPVGIGSAEAAHEIGERAGDQKILLHEAQALPHARGVVGIEDPRQGFGREPLGQRAHELAVAERLEVEVVGRRGGPEPERVDGLAAVAHHRAIEGQADQARRPADDRAQASPPRTSKEQPSLISTCLVRPRDLPRIGPAQPVVRLLVAASRPGCVCLKMPYS